MALTYVIKQIADLWFYGYVAYSFFCVKKKWFMATVKPTTHFLRMATLCFVP